MRSYVEKFPDQLSHALELAESLSLHTDGFKPENVLTCGLGGSGIGGRMISKLLKEELNVPFVLSQDYTIPGFVGKNTLVLACSYSGNTEETLIATQECLKRGARVVCVTTGGELEKLAQEQKLDLALLPAGYPPRTALGYSIVMQLAVLKEYGIISQARLDDVRNTQQLLSKEQRLLCDQAYEIVQNIGDRLPVIYSEDSYEPVAVRLRQQINENAKRLCWHHYLPEMNHNELVGWAGGSDRLAVIFLRNEDDHPRTQERMNISKDIIGRYTTCIQEFFGKGQSRLERAFYLIHLADWMSVHMADDAGVDPIEVKVIDHLKSELAKI